MNLDSINNSEAYAEGVTATALGPGEDYEPHISLTISGTTACSEEKADEYCAYGSNLATTGKTTYSDVYGINIEGADVASYALYIKGDNSGKLSGSRDLASVAAANGETLTPGQWGYIIFDDPSTANENLTKTAVKQLTGSDVVIVSGKDESAEHSVVDVTKGIAFAANFPSDAATGHYKSAVTLSLTASPKKIVDGFGGVFYMQDMTADVCKSVDPGTTGVLIDKRDWNTYTVARIQNKGANTDIAHCWMTSNLAYDIKKYVDDENHKNNLTPTMSDVSSDKLSWAKSDVTVQLGAYSSSDEAKAVYTNDTPSVKTSDSGDYSPAYGYYYSWCAATAGSCSDASGDQPAMRSASESICPAGWKLPTGGAGGQFGDLLGNSSSVAVDTVNYLSAPYNFLLSGGISANGFYSGGSYGLYWSSSSQSEVRAYYLYVGSSAAYLQNHDGRYYGASVRCVVEVTKASGFGGKYYLQDFNSNVCKQSSIAKGATGYLEDKRDGNVYSVGKLQDGNCWMTQNLRLPAGISLTSDNSNVTSASVSPYPYPSAVESTGSGANADDLDYGYWYTWAQATAGTGGNSGDASSSICPKNWVLPSGGAATVNGSFSKLYDSTASGRQWITDGGISGDKKGYVIGGAFFPAAGNTWTGSIGAEGYYWSRTAYSNSSSSSFAYLLRFNSSNVSPQNHDGKHIGYSVRCVVLGS